MSEKIHFQEKFLSLLKTMVASNINLADELADMLNISTDSVYRRLRGQSAFSIDEVGVIAEKFDIPMESIFSTSKQQASFNFNRLYNNANNFIVYLGWYADYLSSLTAVPGTRIIYAADDVPVLRHFNFHYLAAFKAFYWSKAVLNIDYLPNQKFNLEAIPKDLVELNKKTAEVYSKLDCTEIWTNETITSTLKQVQYYWECDFFESNADALLVLADIRQMLNQMNKECEQNDQEGRERIGHFMLYNSDVMIGNNCVLIEPGNSQLPKRVFLGYNTFNTLSTKDDAFIDETSLWMNNLIKKSILLTGSGEKQRSIFFRKMEEKLSALEKSITDAVDS